MMNYLNIESNPIDDIFGIKLESESEIDLSYLEQFASNQFSENPFDDSVTVYQDKSEYPTGPISNLIETTRSASTGSPSSQSPTPHYASPTAHASPSSQHMSPNSQHMSPNSLPHNKKSVKKTLRRSVQSHSNNKLIMRL